MAFDTTARIGSSPFASSGPAQRASGMNMDRFATNTDVIPAAKPPRLWAPMQVPQQNTGDVKMLNKTAPITSPTRPYMIDSTQYDGNSRGGAGFIFDGMNGAD